MHSRPEFANGVLSCSLRTLTGASSIPRQRFEATNTTFQPVSFISFFLYSVQRMNRLLKFTLDIIRVKNCSASVKTHCLSSSLKSSKLLFFFSFSLVFFWAWYEEKLQLQQKWNQNSELVACCWWQYSHVFCPMLKNVVVSPRVKCSSPESQSVTWACTTFLSSHQQLIHLKVRKKID